MIEIKKDKLNNLTQELNALVNKDMNENVVGMKDSVLININNLFSSRETVELVNKINAFNNNEKFTYDDLCDLDENMSSVYMSLSSIKQDVDLDVFFKDGYTLDMQKVRDKFNRKRLYKKYSNFDFDKLDQLYKYPPETLTAYYNENAKIKIDPFVFRKYLLGIMQMVLDHMDLVIAVTGSEGCLAGDTLVQVSRAKNSYKWTMKKLYEKFNGIGNQKDYDRSIPLYTRSFDNKNIRLHKIKNVLYSGKKMTYTLTLETGEVIRATATHKFISRNGWTRLDNLKVGDELLLDTCLAEKNGRKKVKFYDVQLKSPYHKYKGSGRVEIHKLIYEANLNNLTLHEYCDILLNEPERANDLKFIDPSIYHIHHKDGNHYNNSVDNLECITHEEHLQVHGKEQCSNFSQGIVKFSKIVSIEEHGIEDTYDIECEDPYHNFVANNIIVHNSGKSTHVSQLMWMVHWIIHQLKIVEYPFKINDMFFNTLEKLRLTEDDLFDKPFRILALDEGNELHRQNWKEEEVQTFFQRLRRERYNQRIKFICIPVLGELMSSIVLSRVNFITEMKNTNDVKSGSLNKGRANFYIIPRGDTIYSPKQKRELKQGDIKTLIYDFLKDKNWLKGIPSEALCHTYACNGVWGFPESLYEKELKDSNKTFQVSAGLKLTDLEAFYMYETGISLKAIGLDSKDVKYATMNKFFNRLKKYFENNLDKYNKYKLILERKEAEKKFKADNL